MDAMHLARSCSGPCSPAVTIPEREPHPVLHPLPPMPSDGAAAAACILTARGGAWERAPGTAGTILPMSTATDMTYGLSTPIRT